MRIEHGITGKELLVGVMKNGVYEERMQEAKKLEQEQANKRNESIMAALAQL
jgi:hypothetical protein